MVIRASKVSVKTSTPPWLGREPAGLPAAVLQPAIEVALREDVGVGDSTTSALIDPGLSIAAALIFKEPAVAAGLGVLAAVFRAVDRRIQVTNLIEDGQCVAAPGVVAAIVNGPAPGILTGERTALNFLQRMSGVATLVRRFVELAETAGIAILDTRKTTPGLRAFERYAVRLGGGFNHRSGLFDQFLIKDNHLKLAGGVVEAVRLARARQPDALIEVETGCLEEVSEALRCGVDVIMLDNMNPETVREAVALIDGRAWVEVSGGISLDNIEDYLISGVDAISVGALTHSAPNIDISLEVGV